MPQKTTFARKIIQLGKYSLAIVLPKHVLRRFGWRERQNIVIAVRGRDALVIRDWKPPVRRRKTGGPKTRRSLGLRRAQSSRGGGRR